MTADNGADAGNGAPPADRLEAIIWQLEVATRAGKTLEQARRDMISLFGLPEREVDEAVARIRRRMEEVRNRDIPRTMTAEGRESWYLGPDMDNDLFWPALLGQLEHASWERDSIDDLDGASTKVVSMLEHPGQGEFHTKGLVLGYIQSGKTTNFTSVIAKAADAGYRLFIVLSGIHNGLRQQTQQRLDEQLVAPNPQEWIALTDLAHDFRSNVNVNAFLSGQKKVLCVVKKNARILTYLRDWLRSAQEPILRNCPTLLIDDEADQASINTARDQNQPSKINKRIRQIIEALPKGAYVGYTATPFANILIDPQQSEDLYPRDFIVDLPRPAEYVGPETIFGREPLQHDEDDADSDGLDMVRIVDDDELHSLRPVGLDITGFEPAITDSLEDAVRYFLMSTAARRHRGLGNRHATMLVHTTVRVAVHAEFKQLLDGELAAIRARLERDDQTFLRALETQWEDEIGRVPADGLPEVPFARVLEHLPDVVRETRVIVDNSSSDDRLEYTDEPVTAIAVGGNTLSRGLTLEGLCVSFFVRTSNAYDTLLQMGRWFGYRHGYHDLPRIWVTEDMNDWFRHLATVEREIRHDIERYELEHLTPMHFGVRVATHPQLAITAASKMRAAAPAQVSYSGRRLQTIRFRPRDRDWLLANQNAAMELVRAALADAERNGSTYERPHEEGGVVLIRNVDSDRVIEFLDRYRFSARSFDLNSSALNGYIREQNRVGELGRFTLAIMGRGQGPGDLGTMPLGFDFEVPLIARSRLKNIPGDEADIKALMSKEDRAIDLNVTDTQLADMSNGELATLRNSPPHGGHGDGSGLILIYPVSKDSAPSNRRSERVREPLGALEHAIGVGLVFPEAQTTEGRQTYMTADLRGEVVEEPIAEDEVDDEEAPPEPPVPEADAGS